MKTQQAKFAKVSEWIAAGNMKTGLYVVEKVSRETDKAVGFTCEKYNEFGNLKPSVCWVPKSKVQSVENDFYANGPKQMFLIPSWLYSSRSDEGYVL